MTRAKEKDGPPMELSELLAVVGWSGSELARRVDACPSSVYNWLKGSSRTPGAVLAYLDLVIRIRKTAKQLGELDV